MATAEYRVREAGAADREMVIALCRSTLGWADGDPNERFFSWKHDANVFGASPSWLAESEDGKVVGVRVFMRWRFQDPDGSSRAAVRAVDTATDPAWQGRGIFNRLTLGALPDLRRSRTDFVFNTPNDKSRPGYLKMGWSTVGRLPVSVRVAGPQSVPRLSGARTAADRWSVDVPIGEAPDEAFADTDEVDSLLRDCDPGRGIRTDRGVEYLRWRYSFEPLHYRVVPVGDRLRDGLVVMRFRPRGSALEATVCEVLTPRGHCGPMPWSAVLHTSGADYLLRLGHGRPAEGFVPAPRIGPLLTWKPLCRTGTPSIRQLSFSLGDVELF